MRYIKRSKWSEEEDAILRQRWNSQSVADLAQQLHRTEMAVYRRAVALGLTLQREKPKRWTRKEEEFLKKNYTGKASVSWIAKQLGRSQSATYGKCIRMDLTKSTGHRTRWTNQEKIFLVQHYKQMENQEIAKRLGRSLGAVNRMARRMNLKKR